jgi:hypothetical protein
VAKKVGQLVSLTHYLVHRNCWKIEDLCYLQDLCVAPEARGTGLGRALIEAVHATADAAGAPTVYWLTQDFNHEARQLYDRPGHSLHPLHSPTEVAVRARRPEHGSSSDKDVKTDFIGSAGGQSNDRHPFSSTGISGVRDELPRSSPASICLLSGGQSGLPEEWSPRNALIAAPAVLRTPTCDHPSPHHGGPHPRQERLRDAIMGKVHDRQD